MMTKEELLMKNARVLAARKEKKEEEAKKAKAKKARTKKVEHKEEKPQEEIKEESGSKREEPIEESTPALEELGEKPANRAYMVVDQVGIEEEKELEEK